MSGHHGARVFSRSCGVVLLACAMVAPLVAAELEPQTLQAYEEYVASAGQAFLDRIHDEDELSQETNGEQPSTDGRMLSVPGGLVHHWAGAGFIPGADLDSVLAVAQAYDDYAAIHKNFLTSRLLSRSGDTYRVLARVRENAGGVTAILDVWMLVTYERGGACAHSMGQAQEIRQVRNAGRPDEERLPAGRDSGYLWGINMFTRFVERGDGVYMEIETIGLTRSIPRLFRWFVEPIARRLGRASVERTISELRAAVLSRQP